MGLSFELGKAQKKIEDPIRVKGAHNQERSVFAKKYP